MSYDLPPDFDPSDVARMRALDNDTFHGWFLGAAQRRAGGEDTIVLDLIEDRAAPSTDDLMSGFAMPEFTSTEDVANYRALQTELIRRAVGYLGLTPDQVFGE